MLIVFLKNEKVLYFFSSFIMGRASQALPILFLQIFFHLVSLGKLSVRLSDNQQPFC